MVACVEELVNQDSLVLVTNAVFVEAAQAVNEEDVLESHEVFSVLSFEQMLNFG